MEDVPLFAPLDPIADLQTTITLDEARQALAFCLQFFLISSTTEFEQLHDALYRTVEQHPFLGEPLRLLYRRIAQESGERLSFLQIVEEWASAQGTPMEAVGIEPAQWRISLRSGADTSSVRVERGWDFETDETTIIITTRDGKQIEF